MTALNPIVAIVDGNADRYPFLVDLERQGRARVVVVGDGRTALRISASCEPAFWLVNDQLDDMRGIDCIEMLVDLYPDARFFLIADEYNANEERLCFRFKRVKYLCRPLDALWLGRLLHSVIRLPPATGGNARSSPRHNSPESTPTRNSNVDAPRAPPGS